MFIQKEILTFEELEIQTLFVFQNEIFGPYFGNCCKLKSNLFHSNRVGYYIITSSGTINMQSRVIPV